MELSSLNVTEAPSALTAFTHDMVSDEIRGCLIIDFPRANAAISNARIVWLFEAGTSIVPSGRDGDRTIMA